MTLAWFCCPRCRVMFQGDGAARLARCPACAAELGSAGGPADPPEWYYARNRQKVGPVAWSELQRLAAAGQLGPQDMVWRKGTPKWVPAESLTGLFPGPTLTARPHEAELLREGLPGARLPVPTVATDPPGGAADLPAVPGYELLGVLGRGGMGVVYKARQAALKRLVALKMILAGGHAGAEELARFRLEAEAVARLQHPNIVQIYEIGEYQNRPFFSLEFVDGGSLAAKLAGNPLPPREAAKLAETLARAMQAAHAAGIVHRDLKPGNVLLSADGTPKIADFGLAKRLEDDSGQTRTGAVMGTPSYMAPEQAAGQTKAIGPPTDVWALGAILYECLTGRPPFRGASVLETLELVRTQEPVPPSSLQPKVPRDLETICLKCLEKEPAKRYAAAGALADDLGRFLTDKPITARPPSRLYQFRKFVWRNKAPAAGVAATFLMLVVAVTGTTAGMVSAREESAKAQLESDKARLESERATRAAEEAKRQLAKALASSAREKARTGDWDNALKTYQEAIDNGYEDEVEMLLGMAQCHAFREETSRAEEIIQALAARKDLGRHEGEVLLARAKHALVARKRQPGHALELVRQALKKGLPPAQAAYARGLLAATVPEATARLKESLELDPFHSDALDTLIGVLIMQGRVDEATHYVGQAALLWPKSTTLLFARAQLCAIKGDMAQAEGLLKKIKQITGKEPTLLRLGVRFAGQTTRKDLQWELDRGASPVAAIVQELGPEALLQGLAQGGRVDSLGPLFPNNQINDLPFMKEYQRKLAAVDAAGTARPSEAADRMGEAARTWPMNFTYFEWGSLLDWAGRPAEAEKVLEEGFRLPSLIDFRAQLLLKLLSVQDKLRRQGQPGAASDRKEKVRQTLNRLVESGPLPPDRAASAASHALALDEPLLALWLLRDSERRWPPTVAALNSRAAAEFRLGAYERAIATAREVLRREPKNALAARVLRESAEKIKQLQADAAPPKP